MFILFAFFLVLNANADPQIKVKINHPPALGLKVNKIAFDVAASDCSDQITQAIISDMVSNQIEVIDRANLNSILAEHNLTLSGHIDGSSAVSIGKILGPSALVFVKVQRCTTETSRLYEDRSFYNYSTSSSYTKRIYIAKTRAFLKVSIQTVDLTTGRIFAAQALDYSPYRTNESEQGYPEFPSTYDLLDYAMKLAVNQVHNLFLPWVETKELVFFDDRAYGLRDASQAMQANDYERAFTQTQSAIDKCLLEGKNEGKILAHAYYDLGVIYMVQNDMDSSLYYFKKAAQAKPEQVYNEAIENCMKAIEVKKALQKYEVRSVEMPNENSTKDNTNNGNVLTNNDVILLTKNKMSDGIIIQKIKTSKCKFNTNANGLVELSKAGVSDDVIKVMMEKN